MKYYNNKGEQFRLEKGTIADLKSHQGWCDYYLSYEEDSKVWYPTPAMGYIDTFGNRLYNFKIGPLDVITRKNLAFRFGYIYDENGQEYDDADDVLYELYS